MAGILFIAVVVGLAFLFSWVRTQSRHAALRRLPSSLTMTTLLDAGLVRDIVRRAAAKHGFRARGNFDSVDFFRSSSGVEIELRIVDHASSGCTAELLRSRHVLTDSRPARMASMQRLLRQVSAEVRRRDDQAVLHQ